MPTTGKRSPGFLQLPVIPLRSAVLFPGALMSLDIGRAGSIEALEEALEKESLLLLAPQKDGTLDEPSDNDLCETGTLAKIRQILPVPGVGGTGAASGRMIRLVAEGTGRGRIRDFIQLQPYFIARVKPVADTPVRENADRINALVRTAWETFETYAEHHRKLTPEAILSILNCEDAGPLADTIAAHADFPFDDKLRILTEPNAVARLENAVSVLFREIETLKLQQEIFAKVRTGLDKNQREYFLREQLKTIQTELGDTEGAYRDDINTYRERIAARELPAEVTTKLTRELMRLERTSPLSPEAGVIRDYVECVLDLPWEHRTEDNTSLTHAETVLDEDHFGLEKVKERMIEFLAVRRTAKTADAPILCLMGPPGVGKTSVAKSVARALGRKYIRISLGGLRDEAEIRGHRKTYIGAMPGRMVSAVKQAGTSNPLLLLDEIDKMSADFRGNPAAALLEVLDAEQNHAFRDHYLELPFDLSDALFLCTANTMEGVPPALHDRLEIISLSGYTTDEKMEIARRHLIPKQLKKHGLTGSACRFKPEAVEDLIRFYTREAGVRQLEREIARVCRKTVRKLADGTNKSLTVTQKNIVSLLGQPKYKEPARDVQPQTGVCRGLAWTQAGGVTLSVEVNTMPGTGKFELTGSIGTVMKESARAAISYIRSWYEAFQIKKNFYKDTDIHIHIPEGATPKDGPSAGITLATAMVSALTGRPVDAAVAMTGEITLRGRVLPVGGLKEKLLAARQAGVKRVLVPVDNIGDISEIPESVKTGLVIIPVSHMDEVLRQALL